MGSLHGFSVDLINGFPVQLPHLLTHNFHLFPAQWHTRWLAHWLAHWLAQW